MSNLTYHSFDLLIDPIVAGYRARVVASPTGEGETTFAAPFSAAELASFPIAAPQVSMAHDLGGRLYAAVFRGPVRDLWQRGLQAAEMMGGGLRLRLRLSPPGAVQGPDLATWPWELLFDATAGRFLALSIGTPIVRYLDLPGTVLPLAAARPLRGLAVLASPAGYPPVDVTAEWAGMQEALAPLAADGRLALDRLTPPTLDALQRHLRLHSIHILHFVGHGGFDPAGCEGVLVWEDGAGRARAVPAARLAALLHDARDTLRLVMLNSCAGAQSGLIDPFSGTAQALVRSGIPAVVAAQSPLMDRSAIVLAHEFYAAISDGLPVDAALTEARKALFVREGDMAWGNVLLFMRSAEGQLFEMPAAAADEGQPDGEARQHQGFHIEGSSIGRDLDNRGGIFVGRDYKTRA